MTTDKLSEAIGMIDDDIIAAAEKSRAEVKRSKKPLWISVCSTAACAALITAVALTDPAGYLSGTDIVDPNVDGATSSVTTNLTGDPPDHSAGVVDGEHSLINWHTGEATDYTGDVDDAPDYPSFVDGTDDAPVIEVETCDVAETCDLPDIIVGDSCEVGTLESIPIDTEEAPSISYYPTEKAIMLYGASYPTVPKHPDLYDFPEVWETEEIATCDAAVETCEAIEDTNEVAEEDISEPKNWQEADDLWYANHVAMRLPKGTADGLQEFFTRSMQSYLTSSEGENTAYSPLNMYMAMAMLSQTAGGDSREQILNALNAEHQNELLEQARLIWNSSYKNDGVSKAVLANSLWLRNDMHYDSATLIALAEFLHSSSFVGEMGSAEYNQTLKQWLSVHTGGQLDNSIGGAELSEDTVMAILSTIDFSSQWSRRDTFDDGDTQTDVFHGADGDVIVDFMNKSGNMPCYFGDGFTAVYLDGEGYRMWFALPDEGITAEQLAAGDEIYELVFGTLSWTRDGYYDVFLSLPKFDITAETDLKQGMMSLGVTDVFSLERADFTSLTTDTGSYLNRADQAVRVAIDEKGVKAASYTLMENVPTGAPQDLEDVELTFDRPFMFVIENDDGLPMFSGIVNEIQPTEELSDEIISVDVSLCRYDDVEILDDSATGAPQSYEELQDYLSVYSDRMNFVQYEITEQYSPEEAYELTGSDIFLYSSTLYKARITRDLLNDEPKDIEFLLVSAGVAESQFKGFPLLSVGERYASMLLDSSFDTVNVKVEFSELSFALYSKGGTDYAYHLCFDKIRFVTEDGTDIDLGVSDAERYVVTSTANNPVNYVKKLYLDELVDFLRDDWTARGYTFPVILEAPVLTE